MRPLYLRLKGFKGIKAGMNVEEITIDFEKLPPGIIAFAARNGGGKTTILDNAHCFRLMPYRMNSRESNYKPSAFSYYDQIEGDAEKEFIFEVDGVRYRSLIQINAERKKQEAYLFTEVMPGMWKVIEETKAGKLDPYDQIIEQLVGSPELFFTSIFRAQNAKALSDYVKGDIKDLFTELLCIENLKLIGEKAHRVKQYLQDKVETLMLERSRLKAIVDEEATKRTEFVTVTGRIESATKQIDDLDVQLYDLQKQINECDIQVGMETKRLEEKAKIDQELKAREAERVELETDQKAKVRDTNEKVVALTTKISDAQALADKRPTVQKYIDAKDGFETSLVTAREEVKKHDAEIDRITGEIGKIQETETTLAGLEKDLLSIKSAGKVAVDNAQRKRDAAVKEGDKLAKSPCTSCAAKKSEMVLSKVLGGQAPCDKCKFVSDALIEWNKLSEYEAVLTEALKADPRENGITARIDNLKKTISGKTILQKELAWKRTEKSGAQSRVTDLETKLSNAQKALGMLPRIELAEHQLPELRKEKATVEEENVQAEEKMQAKIEALDFIITELSLSLIETTVTGPTWAQQKDGCVTAMAEIKLKIDEIRTQSETDSKAVGAIEQSLSEIGKATVDLEGISQKIEYLNDEISQWATLEKAFGNDGIIALELDDAGPQVATVANELLKEYGGRFQVRIDTQIAKADGKGNKEVFDISVFDNETNEVKSIRKMSGGEKTWIEDSMTKAIALYLASSSGRRYEATFSDEKDGALDPTKKKEFFAAMRRAMELGGYRNLFTITQTPELQSMADAVIRLERGKVEIIIQ